MFLLTACQNAATPTETTTTSESETVMETTVAPENENTATAATTGRSITIRSIGDILIHDFLYNDAATGTGYNFDHMFAPVKSYIENADLTTANLEVIAAGDTLPVSNYPAFNAPSEIIDALQAIGVDIVNNATNHTMDWGAEGALGSIAALKERGMPYVGSYESWQDYNTPRILDINGIKVGFLAYSYGANGNPIPEDQSYLLTLIDTELMALEVEALKEQVDLSIVMVHNGEEYESLPSESQINVNNVVRDAGANFILGGHPHVLQPFIVYNKHQAALFSHGNFLSGQIDDSNKLGGISEYTFTEVNGQFEISKIRFMPTFTIGVPGGSYQVVPLADWQQYGIAGGGEYFANTVALMRRYTNLVEVVDYLD
ncbi:CapA family protein [Aerococcaceae bacterium zg-ZJ1578]|nr:CapA family protein [Aerococcaceae bacterium zg-1578]MBR7927302.1 CapA family protein [Aerococcaceae bacterium zg-ZUI334]MBS4461817.1 CapA family protein [Aerococcaceae bacterium zg-B36]NEW63648.1 CapA family protein [Facklamia sp. 252]NEW67119.1 CapA family protein [Facklamia sp. 253]QQD66498.1 CapA family protein [Aerococcaceae bacterium zg-252]